MHKNNLFIPRKTSFLLSCIGNSTLFDYISSFWTMHWAYASVHKGSIMVFYETKEQHPFPPSPTHSLGKFCCLLFCVDSIIFKKPFSLCAIWWVSKDAISGISLRPRGLLDYSVCLPHLPQFHPRWTSDPLMSNAVCSASKNLHQSVWGCFGLQVY